MIKSKSFVKILPVVIVLLTISTSKVFAWPVVDGKRDDAEGYTSGVYVDFSVEGYGPISDQGELWWYQDPISCDVYVAFTQPLTLIDNSYGANAVDWPRDHKFDDLKGSDKVQFQFKDGSGNTVLDAYMDYIHETCKGSGVYASGGVTSGDGKVLYGDASKVLDWGTSLDYNFNTLGYVLTRDSPATDSDYTENPSYPGWIYEVTYELQVDGNLFGANGFSEVGIPIAHDSPNKIGGNKVYPDPNGPISAPEPSMLQLFWFCLSGAGVFRFIRRWFI